MVQNAEKFLKKLLQPLVDKFEFSIRNQKIFKGKFLSDRLKFDTEFHRTITVDVTKMFSSINVVRVVSIIKEKL
jgi:hypothetical protein